MVQLSHPSVTTGKTIALTIWTFVGKVMSFLFNTTYLPSFQLHQQVWHTHTHTPPTHPENDVVNESQTLFLLPPTSKITIKNYKRFQKKFRSEEKCIPSHPHIESFPVSQKSRSFFKDISISRHTQQGLSASTAPLPVDSQVPDKLSMLARSLRVLEACAQILPPLSLPLSCNMK